MGNVSQTEDSDEDLDYYGARCVSSNMDRRRRNSDMCSCRRRDGVSGTGKYWCAGERIQCFGDQCRTPCKPFAWPGKHCTTGEDCYNDWTASCGNPSYLRCNNGKCAAESDYDYYQSGNCVSRNVERRRRNSNMCSCRRRDGVSSTKKFYCTGHTINCFNEDCSTCTPYAWPGKSCWTGEDCYNDFEASC